MQQILTPSSNAQTPFARLGHSHGYRLDGDAALLNAQIDVTRSGLSSNSALALQLWACEEPHQGGPLAGFKIAEAPIALSGDDTLAQLDAVAFARLPALARDYSMVLVLAAGREGAFDQVFDFANYPERQRFLAPHIEGAAGYKLHDDGSVSLQVDRVVNPRAVDNVSGSLALQLWAVRAPYYGGELLGTLLASQEVGTVVGQGATAPGELRCTLTPPSADASHVVLALVEWTSAGYLARDFCNFPELYRGPLQTREVRAEPVPAQVSAAKAPAAEPVKAAVVAPTKAAAVEPAKVAVVEPAKVVVEPAKVAAAEPAKSVAAEPAKVAAAEPAKSLVAEPVKAAAPVAAEPAKAPAAKVEAAPVAKPEPVGARAPLADAKPAARLSINQASEADLIAATGMTQRLAAEVIKGRPYTTLDKLSKVRGIGDKTVQKLKQTFTL